MVDIIEGNANNWEQEVLRSDILTVVDFWHDSCPWCLRFNPIFEEVAGEYMRKVKFVRFNALASLENRQVAVNLGIMSTPTLIFFCEGRAIGTIVGFKPKEQMQHILNDVIAQHGECIRHSTELSL